ncbi:MAG: hypothetical protein C5B59_07105 [Bacteroidetes bacterium]|nr:MAG: hypothetical protein C5B59_07105 [Bacteroidota bacterium]
MKEFIKRLLGMRQAGGASHAGVNPVFVTDIYLDHDGWIFSWHFTATFDGKPSEDGGVFGPYQSRADAALMRDHFTQSRAGEGTFIHNEGK